MRTAALALAIAAALTMTAAAVMTQTNPAALDAMLPALDCATDMECQQLTDMEY